MHACSAQFLGQRSPSTQFRAAQPEQERAPENKMAWPDVEEVVAHWLRAASLDSWFELAEIEMDQEELGRCDCGYCRKVEWEAGLELRQMWEATAMELQPLLRLEATNRSARALKLRNG